MSFENIRGVSNVVYTVLCVCVLNAQREMWRVDWLDFNMHNQRPTDGNT